MEEIKISDGVEIADPQLRALVMRAVRKTELALEKVAANHKEPDRYPLPADPKSLEQLLAGRFKTLSPTTRKQASARALSRLQAPQNTRKARFGDLAQVDLTKAASIQEQARALPFPEELKITAAHWKTLLGQNGQLFIPQLTVLGVPPVKSSVASTATTDNLELRIHAVKCVDRTSDGIAGFEATDEISIGGTCVDENGDTKKISDSFVSNFDDDGDQRTYSPPWRFTNFNLLEGTAYPKKYFVNLVLAEVDNGGLTDFLNQLLTFIKEEVTSALVAAVVTGIAIGSSGGPVSALIGGAVGLAVGACCSLFQHIWEDEIWSPATLSCTIPSLSARWSGNTYSPVCISTFTGFGGQYQVHYSWQLYA